MAALGTDFACVVLSTPIVKRGSCKLPLVIPRSVRTTSTSLHSSLWPGNSFGALSSSSLDSSESIACSLCDGGPEMGLPPKRPSDLACPIRYPVTRPMMAHAVATFAAEGCAGSGIMRCDAAYFSDRVAGIRTNVRRLCEVTEIVQSLVVYTVVVLKVRWSGMVALGFPTNESSLALRRCTSSRPYHAQHHSSFDPKQSSRAFSS